MNLKNFAHIKGFSWCYKVLWVLANDVMYPPAQHCTEQFHCHEKGLEFHLFKCPTLSSTPWRSRQFLLYITLPCPKCYILRIIYHLAFPDWLHPLSNRKLRVVYVFSELDSAFLFIIEQHSILWIYYCLFLHSSVERPLGSTSSLG